MKIRDVTDNYDSRYRCPTVHSMSYDDEVIFCISKPVETANAPLGYETTGATIVKRKDRKKFRAFFLRTFNENEYEKCTMGNFLTLNRKYYFDETGDILDEADWLNSMDNFTEEKSPDMKYIFMPKSWIKESSIIKIYEQRKKDVAEGKTGAIGPDGPILHAECSLNLFHSMSISSNSSTN